MAESVPSSSDSKKTADKKKAKPPKTSTADSSDGGASPRAESGGATAGAAPRAVVSTSKAADEKKTQGAKKDAGQQKKPGKPDSQQGKEVKQGKGDKAPIKKPENDEQKSKAQLKAERRAKQEAQRAAKVAVKGDAGGASGSKTSPGAATAAKKDAQSEKVKANTTTQDSPEKKTTKKSSKIKTAPEKLTEEEMWARKEKNLLAKASKLDNCVIQLGCQYFYQNVVGANARCLALLKTFKELIGKYKTPEGKDLSRDLANNYLAPCITYLNECRPLSTSMGNAIKHLKLQIQQIPRDMEDKHAISELQDEIDNFIYVNLEKAAQGVADYALGKIDDGDVILVYAASSLIAQVLKTAYKNGKQFRVIVVEGRPRTEGKSMLRFLVRCGIPCSYVYIGSASHAMKEATKVFLGAAAMFAIGDMHSRTGNSMIAALAKANNRPVLVCCETYKFTDKVQLQASENIMHARGSDLLHLGHKSSVISHPESLGLSLLNLTYDVTQSRYITSLITELGSLPCSSVPVVLRRQEDLSEPPAPRKG